MLPVKYLSLQKSELKYEVRIRGATAASSVEELRKQIVKLAPDLPSEHILESPIDVRQDLKGCLEVLTKVQTNLDVPEPSIPTLIRTQNMLNHLHNRLARITVSDEHKNLFEDVQRGYLNFSKKLCNSSRKVSTRFL